MISPGVFSFFFLKFWFIGLLRGGGVKGQKMVQNEKKLCLFAPYLKSHTSYFDLCYSCVKQAANKYYYSSGHHEQKNKKNHRLSQIFSSHNKARNKPTFRTLNSFTLCKWIQCIGSSVVVAKFRLQNLLSSQTTHNIYY